MPPSQLKRRLENEYGAEGSGRVEEEKAKYEVERERTLAEWCALRRYQYTVVTGTGESARPTPCPCAFPPWSRPNTLEARALRSDAGLAREYRAAYRDGRSAVSVLLLYDVRRPRDR